MILNPKFYIYIYIYILNKKKKKTSLHAQSACDETS